MIETHRHLKYVRSDRILTKITWLNRKLKGKYGYIEMKVFHKLGIIKVQKDVQQVLYLETKHPFSRDQRCSGSVKTFIAIGDRDTIYQGSRRLPKDIEKCWAITSHQIKQTPLKHLGEDKQESEGLYVLHFSLASKRVLSGPFS